LIALTESIEIDHGSELRLRRIQPIARRRNEPRCRTNTGGQIS
jgi:hypothetical protein